MMAVAKSLLALALVSRCCGASNATAPKATEANATRSWRSSGCGKAPPVAPGAPATKLSMWAPDGNPLFPSGYAERHYFLWVPPTYKADAPASLVLDFHGFYDNAGDEVEESGLIDVATRAGKNYVVVYPVGSGGGGSGDSRSWNVDGNGLNTEPGPSGPVCRLPRTRDDEYVCFESCKVTTHGCDPWRGCNSAACLDDSGFVGALLESLKAELCVDLNAIHVAGISAGGMMAYQVALDHSDQVASIAPVAGSRFFGFNRAPAHPVAVLSSHGYRAGKG